MSRLRVQDLMTAAVHTLGEDADLQELRGLLNDLNVRHVPIVNREHRLVGLVSQRDLLRHVVAGKAELPLSVEDEILHRTLIRDIMVTDVVTVEPGQPLGEAASIMLEEKFGCLPVVEGSRLVGILTEADFVRYLAERS